MLKILMFLLMALTLVMAIFFVLVRYMEGHAVFFPINEITLTPDRFGLPYEDVYVQTKDNVKINAWFLKNNHAQSTIIFAHGNAGCLSDRLLKIKFFYDLGFSVLAFDYRGFGNSQGIPTEEGIYLDAQAAYDYLSARKDVDMARVIAYGASMGGVVAIDLALNRSVKALIIDSSITSAKEAAMRFYPYIPTFFMKIKFDSIGKVPFITVPKLFIHSPDDQVIPYDMGQKLFKAAALPKEFITSSGGHNEIQIVSDHKTTQALKQFLLGKGLL